MVDIFGKQTIRICALVTALIPGMSTAGIGQAVAQAPHEAAAGSRPAKPGHDFSRLCHYEATGLSLLRPYGRGKVPVVFIHGLWSTPCSWAKMIEHLEADSALAEHYQFWTFGYSTGDPIPYSATLLRRDLDEVRKTVDRDNSDRALDRMIVVGHSMGGLLTKMMVQETGTHLWRAISGRPVDELVGEPADREMFTTALIYKPRQEIRRVIFIATPHRGSLLDRGPVGQLGSRLVRLPDPLRASYHRLIARNPHDFFTERFRKGLPTSLDELEWHSPILVGLEKAGLAPSVKAHSIIADHRDPPAAGGSDGIVPYESAHIDGATSELLVSSGHLCQDHPAVIAEVRRILLEHGGGQPARVEAN
jgi:pimeloyl-ACP methyl ester carboxylesterase